MQAIRRTPSRLAFIHGARHRHAQRQARLARQGESTRVVLAGGLALLAWFGACIMLASMAPQ